MFIILFVNHGIFHVLFIVSSIMYAISCIIVCYSTNQPLLLLLLSTGASSGIELLHMTGCMSPYLTLIIIEVKFYKANASIGLMCPIIEGASSRCLNAPLTTTCICIQRTFCSEGFIDGIQLLFHTVTFSAQTIQR